MESMIISILIIFVCLYILGILFMINEESDTKGIGIVVIVLNLFVFFVFCILLEEYGKKQGQIEALTGKVRYELVTNPDSTKTWEKINRK